jgi:hypothetical protein
MTSPCPFEAEIPSFRDALDHVEQRIDGMSKVLNQHMTREEDMIDGLATKLAYATRELARLDEESRNQLAKSATDKVLRRIDLLDRRLRVLWTIGILVVGSLAVVGTLHLIDGFWQ